MIMIELYKKIINLTMLGVYIFGVETDCLIMKFWYSNNN